MNDMRKNIFQNPLNWRLLLCLMLPLTLASCQALYFLTGKGDQDALFKLPKDKRALVFVDSLPSITLPPDYARNLGKMISDHIYKYKGADEMVGQDRLNILRNDPAFSKMGIADVARATNADLVIWVNIVTFNVTESTDQMVSQGDVDAMVKVVDSDGVRMWPKNDVAGTAVHGHTDPSLMEEQTKGGMTGAIDDQLTVRVGRMFHKYSLDDPDMTK
jgi:hypothetical protein